MDAEPEPVRPSPTTGRGSEGSRPDRETSSDDLRTCGRSGLLPANDRRQQHEPARGEERRRGVGPPEPGDVRHPSHQRPAQARSQVHEHGEGTEYLAPLPLGNPVDR